MKILWHCECAIFFISVCSYKATNAGVSRAQTLICCDSPSLWCRAAMWPSNRITDMKSQFYPMLLFIAFTLAEPTSRLLTSVTVFILL